MAQKTLKIFLFIVIIFALIWGNTYYRQLKYFKNAENLKKQDELLDAIAFYEAAIRMYTPRSSVVRQSIENIWEIGEDYQKRGAIDQALIAFRSIKTSLYAIRSFYSPYINYRLDAEKRVTVLMDLKRKQEKKREGQSYDQTDLDSH